MASGLERQKADCSGSQRAHLKAIHLEIPKAKNLVLRLGDLTELKMAEQMEWHSVVHSE